MLSFPVGLLVHLLGGVLASPVAHHQLALSRRDDGPPIITIPSPVNHTGDVDACQGYKLSSAKALDDGTGVDGVLELKGNCNAYGPDYPKLTLTVRYETNDRLRVRIVDAEGKAHIVPDDVASWPKIGDNTVSKDDSALAFDWQEDPFSFKITRKADQEVLFDTEGEALIFEEQYLRIRSKLAEGSNIQGLGQHNDNFTLPIDRPDYVRTLWTRDSYGVPTYTNLYGAHPFYINQKVGENPSASGTFLLNSQGMDVKFPNNGSMIEYNVIGGIADLFFFNGPSPAQVAQQASQVFGPSKDVPYWSLGFHQCRYGYIDIAEVAEVVANYTTAGIPIQTMWMDIDYMFNRWIMTLDPDRFALEKVRYVVSKLHEGNRDFIVMVDPATFSGTPNSSVAEYEAYQNGVELDIFLRYDNGDLYEGVVWPGPTVFPDFTSPNAQKWMDSEFARFFSPESGVDVSGVWIDMNEPANFLPYLEANIYRISEERVSPPLRALPRIIPRSIPGFEAFTAGQNISEPFSGSTETRRSTQDIVSRQGDPSFPDTTNDYLDPSLDSQWLYPPYQIDDRRQAPSSGDNSASGEGRKNISDFSARTDLVQSNGARTYDEHNLYGSRHAIATRDALIARKSDKRPFTVARSSFSGTPSALWLGDNLSTWEQYIQTIRQMLQFTAVSGVGVVGADSCGFGGNTTETLCARWAWLGAFNTFYRNHNEISSIPQEFYRWNLTTIAARAAGRTRLQLLDYTYTAVHQHSLDGTPTAWPLSWVHPTEVSTVTIESQFYYGPNLLISPVTQENSTSVEIYLPNDVFYDFFTYKKVDGTGSKLTLNDVGYDTMPIHIRGGAIIPLRDGESWTTTENRELPFKLVIAPGRDGSAKGSLYLDDGESLDVGDKYSDVQFKFDGKTLNINGKFGYDANNKLDTVVFTGQDGEKSVMVGERECEVSYEAESGTITAKGLDLTLNSETLITLG